MFGTQQEVKDQILQMDESSFISHYLFEHVPFIFSNNKTKWIEWNNSLSNKIDVDPHNITIIGSAAIGYSLNPHKGFKNFDNKSDIDCAIVSEYHFDLAWHHLRQARTRWALIDKKTREAINIHRTEYLFAGTIVTDRILHVLPYASQWQSAFDEMEKIDPTKGFSVKFRIYKDFHALRSYHLYNIQLLKSFIQEPKVDDETIEADRNEPI
jgi:hypothetical protein